MPNIATALKSEISRIARKEIKSEVLSLRKAATIHRKEIADLKRRSQSLEQALRHVRHAQAPIVTSPKEEQILQRFSAKGLMTHRKRLGLSAAEIGILLGTSSQTIYNWEQGKARPRPDHLPAIAALRSLGKKEAAAVIAERTGKTAQPEQ